MTGLPNRLPASPMLVANDPSMGHSDAKPAGHGGLLGGSRSHPRGHGVDRRVLETDHRILESRFTVLLVNAQPLQQVPGRKSDVLEKLGQKVTLEPCAA